MYICNECDYYFIEFNKCPNCGSFNISKAKEEPKIELEEELKFEDD